MPDTSDEKVCGGVRVFALKGLVLVRGTALIKESHKSVYGTLIVNGLAVVLKKSRNSTEDLKGKMGLGEKAFLD